MVVIYSQLLRVSTVRLRHCNASEPTTSISLVAVMPMDGVSTYSAPNCNHCMGGD